MLVAVVIEIFHANIIKGGKNWHHVVWNIKEGDIVSTVGIRS